MIMMGQILPFFMIPMAYRDARCPYKTDQLVHLWKKQRFDREKARRTRYSSCLTGFIDLQESQSNGTYWDGSTRENASMRIIATAWGHCKALRVCLAPNVCVCIGRRGNLSLTIPQQNRKRLKDTGDQSNDSGSSLDGSDLMWLFWKGSIPDITPYIGICKDKLFIPY